MNREKSAILSAAAIVVLIIGITVIIVLVRQGFIKSENPEMTTVPTNTSVSSSASSDESLTFVKLPSTERPASAAQKENAKFNIGTVVSVPQIGHGVIQGIDNFLSADGRLRYKIGAPDGEVWLVSESILEAEPFNTSKIKD